MEIPQQAVSQWLYSVNASQSSAVLWECPSGCVSGIHYNYILAGGEQFSQSWAQLIHDCTVDVAHEVNTQYCK